jgi:glutaredoxin
MAMTPADKRSLIGLALVLAATSAALTWWRDQRDLGLATELSRLARPGDIRMLSSRSCIYCTQARQWLTAQRVPFSECFIEQDADCATRYRTAGAAGTPTLLVRGEVQLGFSPPQVLQRLQQPPMPG